MLMREITCCICGKKDWMPPSGQNLPILCGPCSENWCNMAPSYLNKHQENGYLQIENKKEEIKMRTVFILTDKIAFMKLHKCGSTSAINTLKSEKDALEISSPWAPDRPVFSIVRNPYSRIVSCWADRISGGIYVWKNSFGGGRGPKMGFKKDMSFDGFVKAVCKLEDKNSDPHFASMSSIVNNCTNGIGLDFYLKLESIEEDWKRLSEYGIKNSIMHSKKSEHSSWKDYYEKNPELKDIVYNRYEDDFNKFNYSSDF